MASSSLLVALFTALLFHRHHAVLVSAAAASSSIQCRSGWTHHLLTLSPSQMNDGYCDCPDSGLDEPDTGACSGAPEGMWAGATGGERVGDPDAVPRPPSFACPQQPALTLPMSRVDDGVCDCCDGADERRPLRPTQAACPDVCGEVLADERRARAAAQRNYALGSQLRSDALARHRTWRADKTRELRQLEEVDLVRAEEKRIGADSELSRAKVTLARHWLRATRELLDAPPLRDAVGHGFMSAEELGAFVLSLCRLSAEVAPGNAAGVSCIALERASLDVGILWESAAEGRDGSLPRFEYLETRTDGALADFAENILLRLEATDGAKEETKVGRRNNKKRKRESFSSDDSGDDPDDDDWEEHHTHDFDDSEDIGEDHVHNYHDGDEEEGESQGEPTQLTPHELLVKSLLDLVPLNRSLFKRQSKRLLKVSSASPEDVEEAVGEKEDAESAPNDESPVDKNEDENEDEKEADGEKATTTDHGALDPEVALTLSRHQSNIARGEAVAKSAARFVASVMERSDQNLGHMEDLAIMTLYHSKLAAEDVAELVYSTSSALRPASTAGAGGSESDDYSCSSPWNLGMCPTPTSVSSQDGNGRTYPPAFIVKAAQRRCQRHEENSMMEVCASAFPEADEIALPGTIPDGYYNYYVPQLRETGAEAENEDEEGLALRFSKMDALHEQIPPHLAELTQRKEESDEAKKSISKQITVLEQETGADSGDSGSSKYGTDGELYLYALHDTRHSIVTGKYEFELNIWGKAVQRDVGQTSGGTQLGEWEKMDGGAEGQPRTMRWRGGQKCWNGPERSAEVVVTCGAETKLLTADEPDICRYVFTMESPIGCDEHVRLAIEGDRLPQQ